jgi:hypothetical protein
MHVCSASSPDPQSHHPTAKPGAADDSNPRASSHPPLLEKVGLARQADKLHPVKGVCHLCRSAAERCGAASAGSSTLTCAACSWTKRACKWTAGDGGF